MRRRNEEVSDKHECLNLWNNKLCHFFFFFSFSQRPHPPDGDGDQSGRGSGAQDPSQIRRPRICQRKRTPYTASTVELVPHVLPEKHLLQNVH